MNRTVIDAHDTPYFPTGAAVVVGGSGGIGRVVCARLAEHGTDVALTYRSNAAAAAEAVDLVEAAGRQAYAAPVDLTDAAAVGGFVTGVAERFGRIHTIVFAVGGQISMTYTADIDPDEWRQTLDEELTGFFNVMKASVPLLRGAGGGSIVAVTSAGLVKHPPKDILSTVPKAGIEALVRGLAREEGRNGIRANSVALGVIDAGLFLRVGAGLSDEYLEAMKRNTAVRRLGTAREAADAVVFLASSASGYTTGHRFTVDGGFSL